MNPLKCTACDKRSHKLTREAPGVWHCPDCKTPGAGGHIKAVDGAPPNAGTLKLLAVVAVRRGPDYSRN